MNDQITYFVPQLHADTPPYTGTLSIPTEIEQLAKDVNEILLTKMNTIHPKQPQGGRKWLGDSGKPWSKHFTKYGWIKTESILFRYWMDTRLFTPWIWRNLATSNLEGKSTKLITFFSKGSEKITPDCSTPEAAESSDTTSIKSSALDDTDNAVDASETMGSSDTSMTEATDITDNDAHVADKAGPEPRRSNRIEDRENEKSKWFFKCRACGLNGENVGDDGRPSMRCDKCDTWSHLSCNQALGVVDDELTLGDIAEQGFVCENCRAV